MKITRKLATGTFTVATILGVGGGVAYAQTSTTAPPATSVAPSTSSPTAPSSNSPKAEAAEPTTSETESATESATEAPQPSDGPGGHADGPGDVQNVGGAGEL